MYKSILPTIFAVFICCLTVIPVLADDINEKKLKAYPNPVDRGALVKIEMPNNNREVTVVLYNTVGKQIQTFKSSNNQIAFTAPDISGIYFLRFVENQKVIAVEKIVVKE